MHPQLLFGPSRFQIQPEVEVEVRLQARMRDHILQNIKNVNFLEEFLNRLRNSNSYLMSHAITYLFALNEDNRRDHGEKLSHLL